MRRIGIIGYGNIGSALGEAILKSRLANCVIASKRNSASFTPRTGITLVGSPSECVQGSDVVICAVKPAEFPGVLNELAQLGAELDEKLFLSVVTGIRVERIQSALKRGVEVVRAMPNICALVSRGVTGMYAQSLEASQEAEQIFRLLDDVIKVPSEDGIDALTALTASGPAFVAEFIRTWGSIGESIGLSAAEAGHAALQVFAGTVSMLERDGDIAEFIARIRTPGGTTLAGLTLFGERDGERLLWDMYEAARARARELSGT